MGKLLIGTASCGALATVSVGGVLLARSGSSSEAPSAKFPKSKLSPTLPKNLVSNFKNEYKKLGCISEYFHYLDLDNKWGPSTSDFPDDFEAAGGKSCLIVNWNADRYINNKWRGSFDWLWTFMEGVRGFILMGSADSSTGSVDAKLNVNVRAYMLEISGYTWKIKYEKEVTSGVFSAANFDTSFVKFPDSFAGKSYSGANRLGFLEEEDIINLCITSDGCTDESSKTTSSFRGLWTWESPSDTGEDNDYLISWNSNLSDWQTEFLGNQFKLVEKIKDLKGTWREMEIVHSPPRS